MYAIRYIASSFFTPSTLGFDLRRELFAFASGKDGPATPGAAAKASLKRFADSIRQEIMLAHLLSGPKRIDIAPAVDGSVTVTIHADEPAQLATKDGLARPEVKALVEKILGHEAVVKVVKAAEAVKKE